MIKIENAELESEIIKMHETGVKKRKIAKSLEVSTSYVDRVILERSKPKRILVPDDGFVIVAKCKKTGMLFEDYENRSGLITIHVVQTYPEFKIPTPFKRRKFFKESGRFWYEDFFDIIQTKKQSIETKKCKYCDWETADIDNKSGWYTTHLSLVHGKTIDVYVGEFPEEKNLFKTHFAKKEKRESMLSSSKNHISCKICGEKMSKVTNSHLLYRHGMTLFEYRMLHDSTLSESSLGKFKKLYNENLKNLPGKFISKPQAEIASFITEMGFSVDLNNKTILSGTEMDIFVKDKMLAFEFDGLYFHSEKSGNKSRLYHREKTRLAGSKGIRLIHIFEDEWQNKTEIVKSKIKHLLGKNNSVRIHARKMTVSRITRQEKEIFLDKNHIQGTDDSSLSYGAFFDDHLCAVMTFDDNRSMNREKGHKAGTYELKRFAVETGYGIPGIGSRLISRFMKDFSPKRIVSFADLRWSSSDSNVYKKMGFRLEKEIAPDYSYTMYKSGVAYRFHKFGYGKKSIARKFPDVYAKEKTEWEMMQEKGFDRIWDCGKLKYIMEP